MKRRPYLSLVAAPRPKPSLADHLARRAYKPVYRPGQVNPCPGCGRSQWHVGRSSAECAFCEALLPIAPDGVVE